MRRNEAFTLCRVAGVPYLLPSGQEIADHKSGVQLNETGVFLWELLKEECSPEELAAKAAAQYRLNPSEEARLQDDIACFLQKLGSYGMLLSAERFFPDIPFPVSGSLHALGIGGLRIDLCCPETLFARELEAFSVPASANPDMTVTAVCRPPLSHPNGAVLLRSPDLMVLECGGLYVLLFPSTAGISEAHLAKDGSRAVYYCRPLYTETLRQELFHALRLSFLYLSQQRRMAVLHSASLYYRGKAWLFSGRSGTGKSTHTNLWHEQFGVPLLNGDLNLLSMENSKPFVHGLPWCGTSGIASAGSYPLGGIILLKQSPENHVESLPSHQAQLLVTQRLISPAWTAEQLRLNLGLIAEIAPTILICRLYCTREPTAAEKMRQAIDRYLDAGE